MIYGRALEKVGSFFLKILNFLLEMVYKSIFSMMYGVVMLLQRIYSLIYLFFCYVSVVSYIATQQTEECDIGVLFLFVLCKIGNWELECMVKLFDMLHSHLISSRGVDQMSGD